MNNRIGLLTWITLSFLLVACSSPNDNQQTRKGMSITAEEILGNTDYLAISYGGYRQNTRDSVPSVSDIKEDMKILEALGIRLIRTYHAQQFPHAANVLEAIHQLKNEDSNFEMYVMLGAWIECKGAWTDSPDHNAESIENNIAEIEATVAMASKYPDIVKIIAVGNEAMINWAAGYYVSPKIILKWVNYLQEAKKEGKIPAEIWITSSDNFESWGGGSKAYHTEDLNRLIEAVDYLSVHTYPFHDTHYNSSFWGVPEEEESLSDMEKAESAVRRAKKHAISHYQGVLDYMEGLAINKPVHIGETGWSSISNSLYGSKGSQAADEYKQKHYYDAMREWSNSIFISCFFFEAFDEPWKDSVNALGSENHFGLIDINGRAKYVLWDEIDAGVLDNLKRNGLPILKTYNGDKQNLLDDLLSPPLKKDIGISDIETINENREVGEAVTENTYVILNTELIPDGKNDLSYPSEKLKLNAWEGTCGIIMGLDGIIDVSTGTGNWWGCAIELQSGSLGENLSNFNKGSLHFEIKGNSTSRFKLGFQTGTFSKGTQVSNYVTFGPSEPYLLEEDWKSYTIPLSELDKGADLKNVTAVMFFMGDGNFDGKEFSLRNIYYTK